MSLSIGAINRHSSFPVSIERGQQALSIPSKAKSFLSKLSIKAFSPISSLKKIKKACHKGKQVINEATVGVSDKTLTGTRSVVSIIEEHFHHSNFVSKGIQASRILVLLAVPFALHNMYLGIKDLRFGNKSEKIDAALSMISEVGAIGDCTATFAEGLVIMDQISHHAAVWTGPLIGASAALSAAAILAQAKGCWESHRFLKVLEKHKIAKTKKETPEAYQKTFEFLLSQDKSVLKKHFKVGGNKLKQKIEDIWTKENEKLQSQEPKEVEKAQSKLSETLKLLKNRINVKKFSHALAITSAIICIIATAVILCSPLAPVAIMIPLGYGLLALSSTGSIGKFAFDMAMKRRFKKAFGLIAPKTA